MSDTETLTADEDRLVTLYHDMLMQMSRAVSQHASATGIEEQMIVGTAIRVLQGRLEGVGLAWYVLHGEDDAAEDRLRALATARDA